MFCCFGVPKAYEPIETTTSTHTCIDPQVSSAKYAQVAAPHVTHVPRTSSSSKRRSSPSSTMSMSHSHWQHDDYYDHNNFDFDSDPFDTDGNYKDGGRRKDVNFNLVRSAGNALMEYDPQSMADLVRVTVPEGCWPGQVIQVVCPPPENDSGNGGNCDHDLNNSKNYDGDNEDEDEDGVGGDDDKAHGTGSNNRVACVRIPFHCTSGSSFLVRMPISTTSTTTISTSVSIPAVKVNANTDMRPVPPPPPAPGHDEFKLHAPRTRSERREGRDLPPMSPSLPKQPSPRSRAGSCGSGTLYSSPLKDPL